MADQEKKETSTSSRTRARFFCPFVMKPFDECHCSGTGSDNAEATIRLCGWNFESCEIYKRRRWEKASAQ
jgi:hypothetical protein